MLLVFFYLTVDPSLINTTLAGVAQSVERVALITAKRSTSRSWVRAPPSAIPISQAHQSSCSFAFLLRNHSRVTLLLVQQFLPLGNRCLSVVVAWEGFRLSVSVDLAFLLSTNRGGAGRR
jgi:hypothetical protein